jgi:hypothetical protein
VVPQAAVELQQRRRIGLLRQLLLAAGGEVGLEQIPGGDPVLQLAHPCGKAGRIAVPVPGVQGHRHGLVWSLPRRWEGRDQGHQPLGQALQAAGIVPLQPQRLGGVVKHQQRIHPHRPEHRHGWPLPVVARLQPGPRLIAEPAQPHPPIGLQLGQGRKGVAATGVARQPPTHHLGPGLDRQQAAAAQGRAVAVEPHQAGALELGEQGSQQALRFAPGQGPAPRAAHWQSRWGPSRRQGLARAAWPAAIRASSRMRQLSHTPQGSAPPL